MHTVKEKNSYRMGASTGLETKRPMGLGRAGGVGGVGGRFEVGGCIGVILRTY